MMVKMPMPMSGRKKEEGRRRREEKKMEVTGSGEGGLVCPPPHLPTTADSVAFPHTCTPFPCPCMCIFCPTTASPATTTTNLLPMLEGRRMREWKEGRKGVVMMTVMFQ